LLFSDGLYEIEVGDGFVMAVDDFIDLLQRGGAVPAIDLDGILEEVRRLANGAAFSDDVSILRLDFASEATPEIGSATFALPAVLTM
jgi:serine phosphatase RsbU (regulator of sigma subunit)